MGKTQTSPGTLYMVATPIGNMDDISSRALDILGRVDWIAAEDTRRTARLLSRHQIRGRTLSCHEHNEKERSVFLIQELLAGRSVAYVSDAGSPAVSDPGARLVKEAADNGIDASPIPGPSAAIAILTASGMSADSFMFAGFCPRKKSRREKRLKALAEGRDTLVFYESPKRILPFLDEMIAVMGDREAVLGREMTKLHEEFIRGALSHIRDELAGRPSVKGECALAVSGSPPENEDEKDPEALMAAVRDALGEAFEKGDMTPSQISRKIAARFGLPRSEVYGEAMKIRREKS
ncbi:putative methyltransferase [Candidatus Desulfarcum epimagneticum]|uniref:Ribosomal RNA small subunit methyltransferase I n=1 Tax=uncultured Desulfobacteraceae bacterium TaxID=218296 RepID=A0A484HHW6_9BACT|nr:putative methyltransferase [uncultured Desulfobacteraceae bacterium]